MKHFVLLFVLFQIGLQSFGQGNKKYVNLNNTVVNDTFKAGYGYPKFQDEFDSLYIRNLFPQDTVSNDYKLINDRWKWCWAGRGWPGLPLYHLFENVLFHNAANPEDRYIKLQVNQHDTGVVDPPLYPYTTSMFPMKMDYSV